jgi:phosphotransferase system enzyme I (PtsI)
MQTLDGIAASPGVAIGEALVIDNEGFRIPRHFVARDAVGEELERLDKAIGAVAKEMEHNRDSISQQLGDQVGAIFAAHLQMLLDPRLRDAIERLIRENNYSPEYAVSHTLRGYAKVFQESDSPHLAERVHDIFDLEKSLLRNLLGRRREELSHLTSPVVVLAHNLTPSETANLNPDFVTGFVTEVGGAGGHTAIVAKGLEIVAVVGIGKFLTDVSGGDMVIVDGDVGRVILQPDEQALARYRAEAERRRLVAAQLEPLRDLPAETRDGVRIGLLANIEFPHEVGHCLDRGADGIGLYRTEFLYVDSKTEPTEEDHYLAYAQVVRAMEKRPVVIRTLDLVADKMGLVELDSYEKRNPSLGLRSIRLALRNQQLFRPQLRAILRASVLGDVRVMFPLISTLQELREAKDALSGAMEDLSGQGIEFNRQLRVGMMVESPAAAMMIDKFLPEVQFISIGTNDLTQYTLAVDRTNPDVADLYQATDPAVLRLIDNSLKAAVQANVEASLCGQMSGDPAYTMLLLGLGLREMSVPPLAIPEIKKICRSVTIAQCEAVAERAMTMESARDVDVYLRAESKKIEP